MTEPLNSITPDPPSDTDQPTPPAQVQVSELHLPLVVAGALVVAAGILLLLMGLFLLFVAPHMQQAVSPMGLGNSGFIVSLSGATVLAIGVGLFLARRWARNLGILFAVGSMVLGLFSLAAALLAVPQEMGFAAGMVTALVLLIPMVLAPLGLLILLLGKRLTAHVEAKDPGPSWTESRPLPLVGLVLYLAFGALGSLSSLNLAGNPDFQAMLRVPSWLWQGWSLSMALGSAALAWGLWTRLRKAWLAAWLYFPFTSLVGWAILRPFDDLAAAGANAKLAQGMGQLGAGVQGMAILVLVLMCTWLWWVKASFPPAQDATQA